MATGCSGMRSITVPPLRPRSHDSDGACGSTIDTSPGQNASMSSRAVLGTDSTSPSIVDHEPTSTPTGMSGPRFFAASNARTAVRGERVRADAVDRVGRHHHEPPGTYRARGGRQAVLTVRRTPAVVHHTHSAKL